MSSPDFPILKFRVNDHSDLAQVVRPESGNGLDYRYRAVQVLSDSFPFGQKFWITKTTRDNAGVILKLTVKKEVVPDFRRKAETLGLEFIEATPEASIDQTDEDRLEAEDDRS